jgi:hypothetical protein
MDYLKNKHPHERDSHIIFDEEPHIYTIDGDSDYMSVTTWNHSHFSEFDADAIIDKMMASKKWPESKYFGKTKDEIKQQWEDNGKEASQAGTKMHFDIECFYNNVEVDDIGKNTIEYKYFQAFHNDYVVKGGLEPYRTEWMIYDKELRFAGSVDMLYQNPDGTLEIYDWKRSKEIKFDNRWQSGTTKCVNHLPDCNYFHYSLQLNTYKALLEKNYGVKINGMYLVCLHPNNGNHSYQRIKVNDMTEEIVNLFKLRKKMLGYDVSDIYENEDEKKNNYFNAWPRNDNGCPILPEEV